MNKFLAIVKREYLKRVSAKSFIVATLLGPVLMVAFMAVPVLIAMFGSNEVVHIAILDESERMYERLSEIILRESREAPSSARGGTTPLDMSKNPQERARDASAILPENFKLEQVTPGARSLEAVKQELNARVLEDKLDGYLIIPADVLSNRKAEYYGRNVGDLVTQTQLEEHLGRAINEQRLADAGVNQNLLEEISKNASVSAIKVSEKGEEREAGGAFFFVLGVGFLIFMAIMIYGGVILSAVMEEKETRVIEMLFSSVSAFPLMLGKLIGVSLVALTQFAIWGIIVSAFVIFGLASLTPEGSDMQLPSVSASAIIYFFLFFLLGYFIYSSLFALIGSIVTTQEESQQFVMLLIFPLIIAFYLVFPVLRSPDSTLAFWASLFPLTSPVVMLVRIVTQTPPFWQILLSWLLGVMTVILLIWLASRIYRIGMLMYGKRATIPEIMRWVKQS